MSDSQHRSSAGRPSSTPRWLTWQWLLVASTVLLVAGLLASVAIPRDPDPSTEATAGFTPAPVPEPGPVLVPAQARSEVTVPPDARIAMAMVDTLVTIGPRPAGSDADVAARAVITRQLQGLGWTVVEEEVALPQGGSSANVVAWRGGDDPRGERHIVVGAHHDTVPGSPGGNDNASGIGVLTALAENLSGRGPPRPVVLVAFAAEERQPDRSHHLGSELYASRHAEQVEAMVSADMLGHGSSTCICFSATGSTRFAEELRDLAQQRGLGAFHVRRIGEVSDHAPFARRGVPAVLVWTELEPRYHSPRDTADHVGLDEMRRAAALIADHLRQG